MSLRFIDRFADDAEALLGEHDANAALDAMRIVVDLAEADRYAVPRRERTQRRMDAQARAQEWVAKYT